MADTIKEQILQQAIDRAKPLSQLPILRCERSIDETDNVFVSIWDGDENGSVDSFNRQAMVFPLAIECIWQARENEHSSEAAAKAGDIISLFQGSGYDFNGLASKIEFVVASPQYPSDGGTVTTLTVIFNITYKIPVGDAFTNALTL